MTCYQNKLITYVVNLYVTMHQFLLVVKISCPERLVVVV